VLHQSARGKQSWADLRPFSAAGMEGANRARGRTLTGGVRDIAMRAFSCMIAECDNKGVLVSKTMRDLRAD
jgi:hypothetical protein